MPAVVRAVCTSLVVAALVAAGCGSSGGRAERSLDDPARDVAAATGPDVVAVTVERDGDTITFRVRFAAAPPLEVNEGATPSLIVARDELGSPETLAISIAAAREWNDATDEPAGVTPDVVPDTGTWRVELE